MYSDLKGEVTHDRLEMMTTHYTEATSVRFTRVMSYRDDNNNDDCNVKKARLECMIQLV